MNSGDERIRGRHAFARAHRFAHACELVERGLCEAERAVVGRDDLAVDQHEQGFEFVAQVAHGHEASHAGAAFECVQRTLQRVEAIDTAAVLVPLRQCALRLLDELDGFVRENAGDVLIEVRDDVFDHLGWRSCGDCLRGRYLRKGSGRSRDRRRDGNLWGGGRRGCWCGGELGGTGGRDDALIEIFGGLVDAREQSTVRLEKPGGFIEIRGNRLHGIHAIREQIELFGLEADAAVE